jgi:hypothetical protein
MSEVYSRTTTQSAGSNLLESIKSFAVGVVLFLASFVVLYWNEGRTDMSEVAKRSTVVQADNPGTTGEGKLVSVTSNLQVDESVGDPELLVPGQYVKLHRKVEMYSWKEKYDKKTEKKLGGGSVTKETVEYNKVWQENPPDSSNFKVPKGHWNPKSPLPSQDFYASKAKVGAFTFSPKESESTGGLEGGGLPSSTTVTLTAAMVKGGGAQGPKPAAKPPAKPGPATAPTAKATAAPKATASAAPSADAEGGDDEAPSALTGGPFKLTAGYLFRGHGAPEEPGSKLGDLRISYQAVMPGKQVTLFGKRTGNTVVTYTDGDDKLLRAVEGTRDAAIEKMHGEHVMLTWILRIVGFVMMWSGLGMILSPINAVLDIVPFIGSAGRMITSIAMFPVALVLSIITIMVSIVAHSPILLILTILLVGGGITALVMTKRKKAAANPQPAPAGGMPPMGYQGGPPPGAPPQGYGGPPQGGYGPPPGGGAPPGYGGPPQGGYGPPPGGGAPPRGGYGGPPPGGYGPPPA